LRFGRGAADLAVEIVLDDPAVPRLAGEVRAVEDHWQLSNFSAVHSYLVENPEGAGEYLRVAPRRLGAPVPFEFARVVLPALGEPRMFQVYAPAHSFHDAALGQPSVGSPTLSAFALDEAATYFLVLVALCEPRLRDRPGAGVPTTRQVVERLQGDGVGREVSEHAVTFHLDYLARNKLRIRQSSGPRTGKREAVVSLALRFGLVREEHLALLPPRPKPSMETT